MEAKRIEFSWHYPNKEVDPPNFMPGYVKNLKQQRIQEAADFITIHKNGLISVTETDVRFRHCSYDEYRAIVVWYWG